MAKNRYIGEYPVIGIRPIIDGMDESVREEIITELRQKLDSKEI